MTLASMFLYTSCVCEDIIFPEQESEYVTVDLGVTGEYLKVSESPLMSRTESTLEDLINIRVCTIEEDGNITTYASGIFTSLENLKIKLLNGKKYNFYVSIIADGYKCLENNTCDGFSGAISTNFNYSSYWSSWHFDNLSGGSINAKHQFKHDHFYGELTDFTPTKDGNVNIETKRTAYGVHYIAEGLTEGDLKIDVGGYYFDLSYSVNLTVNNQENNGIYTFSQIREAWIVPNYYATKKLNISWTKDNGSIIPLGTYEITFKRNVKTTIRIKLDDQSTQSGIVITREETPMANDDNEYVIEGGEMTEVPVTTTPQ